MCFYYKKNTATLSVEGTFKKTTIFLIKRDFLNSKINGAVECDSFLLIISFFTISIVKIFTQRIFKDDKLS
jgi:hypothetical protein